MPKLAKHEALFFSTSPDIPRNLLGKGRKSSKALYILDRQPCLLVVPVGGVSEALGLFVLLLQDGTVTKNQNTYGVKTFPFTIGQRHKFIFIPINDLRKCVINKKSSSSFFLVSKQR